MISHHFSLSCLIVVLYIALLPRVSQGHQLIGRDICETFYDHEGGCDHDALNDNALNSTTSSVIDLSRLLADTRVTYRPGAFSEKRRSRDNKLNLSNGLVAKPIAISGQQVKLRGNSKSSARFHINPDGAAVIEKPNPKDGYYYVSNAESMDKGNDWNKGGVGSIEFNVKGVVIGYERVASRTRNNCSGGKTPWNSWVTCEEADGGRIYQTDPRGNRDKRKTNMGKFGHYESFAYDPETVTFYVTRDSHRGVLTRFTPNTKGMECFRQSNDYDRWCTLEHGTVDYLLISGGPKGTFRWTTNVGAAQENANKYYPHSEGLDIYDGMLYTTNKKLKRLMILNLRTRTYTYETTKSGAFNNQPDQVARLVQFDDDILYFCEDGGRGADSPGVFGRDTRGRYFTILYGRFPGNDETTGLAFSPDGRRMYVSYQKAGIIYDVWREDGLPFHGAMLDIKYH